MFEVRVECGLIIKPDYNIFGPTAQGGQQLRKSDRRLGYLLHLRNPDENTSKIYEIHAHQPMKRNTHIPCIDCQVGTMRFCHTLFFRIRDGRPICVPDFPAWVCDICGRREYDSSALAELQAVLETNRRSRQKPFWSLIDTDQDQLLTGADP